MTGFSEILNFFFFLYLFDGNIVKRKMNNAFSFIVMVYENILLMYELSLGRKEVRNICVSEIKNY